MLVEMRCIALVLLIMSWPAVADVPVTFQPGTAARAADVNQNFSNIDARLNSSLGGLIVSSVISAATGVAGASCPSDRIVLSANCDCNYENGTRNYGVLFGCSVAGNGGVAGCYPEGTSYNPNLPSPLATVHLRCLSGITNNGTPIQPTYVPLSAKLIASRQTDATHEDSKTSADTLEVAIKSLQDQILDFETRLRSRTK
jgi:hypothetical protein